MTQVPGAAVSVNTAAREDHLRNPTCVPQGLAEYYGS
jgi:hypothetical protein